MCLHRHPLVTLVAPSRPGTELMATFARDSRDLYNSIGVADKVREHADGCGEAAR